MSMYGDYVRERLGDEILESDQGFVTYRYLNEGKTVYVVDLYVAPQFRKSQYGQTLTDAVIKIAKEKGCTEMIGTVSPAATNATYSMKVLIAYGMELKTSNEMVIVFRKDI